jgi:hypothetical protein
MIIMCGENGDTAITFRCNNLVMIKYRIPVQPLSGTVTIFSSLTMIACKKKGYENPKISGSQYLLTN